MTQKVLYKYKSRRNDTQLVQSDAGVYVSKHFLTKEGFLRELQIYNRLRGSEVPCAEVVLALDTQLLLTKLPGSNLVDCLDRQERSQYPQWIIWEKLVNWLVMFRAVTGCIMADVNLRNFMYDERTQTLYGLDFEECVEGSLFVSAAKVAAFIRTYAPENTPLKQEISKYVLHLFSQTCGFDMDLLFRESKRQETILLERRKKRI